MSDCKAIREIQEQTLRTALLDLELHVTTVVDSSSQLLAGGRLPERGGHCRPGPHHDLRGSLPAFTWFEHLDRSDAPFFTKNRVYTKWIPLDETRLHIIDMMDNKAGT